MDILILILSNKSAERDIGDAMVVRADIVKVTWFKGLIKIKEDPGTTGSFTFQGVVIPGSVKVVVDKGDVKVVKVGGG